MRRFLRQTLLAVAFSLLYLLVLPTRAGPEIAVRRFWSTDFSTARVDSSAVGNFTVDSAGSFAYVSTEGVVTYRAPRAFGLAASSSGFINHGQNPDQLVLQSPDGGYMQTLAHTGYPAVLGDAILVLEAEDTRLSVYSNAGERMWTAELEAPLLTVAHDAGVTAVGLMSGGLAVFDEAGARFGVDGLEEPYSVTAYGTAVHRATGSIAAVVGPADPAVMVFEAFDRTYAPSLRIGMLDNRWEPTVLEFSSDGRYVLFEDGGVRIVNVETAEEATAALALNVVRVRPVGPDGVFAALGAGGPSDPRHGFRPPAEFTLFDRAGTVPVRQRFWSSEPGLTIAEGRFVLTDGSRLYCFELTGL